MFPPLAKYVGFYQEFFNGIDGYLQLGNKLVHLAEQARAFRQTDSVVELGEILSNYPVKRYQPIGHYYLAIVGNRPGTGDLDNARGQFERIADTAPPVYKAKAMHSLAAVSAFRKDFDSELYYLVETLKASCDFGTTVDALRGIAVRKARAGDHNHAIKDLERILPLIKYAPPHIYFAYLNSLAVELGEVGRKYEARNICHHILASPLAIAYPEWRETAEELKGPNKSFASVDPPSPRLGNLLSMPAVEHAEPVKRAKPAPVINLETWKTMMSKKKNDNLCLEEMDGRQLLLRMMELGSDMTDAKLYKVVALMEKLLSEPDETQKPDGDNLGA